MKNILVMFAIVSAFLSAEGAQAAERNLEVSAAAPAQSAQKLALVIGNADYKSSPLKNPVNDARAMAAKLKELGFDVIEYENLQQKQLGRALREFRTQLQPGAIALFFYAGHGLQVKGVNYLPAVDAEIESEDDIPLQSLDVKKIFDILAEAQTRLNLVFLDACRNNPYTRSFRSMEGGLAKVDAPSGTLISFATRPGSVARDGDGNNGLYTQNLLNAMDTRDQPIEQVLKKVTSNVKQATNGMQEPWMEGSIEGDFYFRGGAQSAESIERTFWETIKDSSVQADFDTYLTRYPNGQFVDQAKEAKARLEQAAQAEAQQREEDLKRHREDELRVAQEKQRLEEERRAMAEREQKMQEDLAQAEERGKQRAKAAAPAPYVPPAF